MVAATSFRSPPSRAVSRGGNRYAAGGRKHNSGAATSCRRLGNMLPRIFELKAVLRALWPSKTDQEIAARTGIPDRTCRYWLSKKCDLPGVAIAGLLQSEEGFVILETMMGDAKPKWWTRMKRSARLAYARQQAEEARKAIAQLELEFAERD